MLMLSALCTAAQKTIVIKDVNIVDVEKGIVLANRHVTIQGNKISSISRGAVPKADSIIDGKNQFLIPGLWDMHTHVFNADLIFPLLIANGVTGIRGMAEDMNTVHTWRQQISAGTRTGPQIFAAGPLVDGPQPTWPNSVIVKTEGEAGQVVDSLRTKLRVDFVKVYSSLTPAVYRAIAAACRMKGIVFAGHVPNAVTVLEAGRAGQKTQEHLYGFIEAASDSADHWYAHQRGTIKDSNFSTRGARKAFLYRTYNPKNLDKVLEELKKTDTWICPTLAVNRGIGYITDTSLLNDERMRYVGAFMRSFWNPYNDARFKNLKPADFENFRKDYVLRMAMIKKIYEAGIPLLAGTDFPNPHCYPGFSLHDEMALMVEAGLSPAAALKTATYNPAAYFGIEKTAGTVAVGKEADLVLLAANPLQSISATKQINLVLLNGRVFSKQALETMKEGVAKQLAVNPVSSPVLGGMHVHEE